MRDKKVMETLAAFPVLPPEYAQQIERILSHLGSTPMELTRSVDGLVEVWSSVVSLRGVHYEPKFRLSDTDRHG